MPQRNRTDPVTREMILEAAASLFRKKGYRATTLEDIGAVFGFSRPALYYYFSNKVQILIDVYKRVFFSLIANFDSILCLDVPPVVKLARILRYHTLFIADNATFLGIYFEEEREIPEELRDQIAELRRTYNRRLRQLYEEGIRGGVFLPLDASMMISLMLGSSNWVYRWYRPDGRYSREQYADTVVRVIMRGCLVELGDMAAVEQVLAEPLPGPGDNT